LPACKKILLIIYFVIFFVDGIKIQGDNMKYFAGAFAVRPGYGGVYSIEATILKKLMDDMTQF